MQIDNRFNLIGTGKVVDETVGETIVTMERLVQKANKLDSFIQTLIKEGKITEKDCENGGVAEYIDNVFFQM